MSEQEKVVNLCHLCCPWTIGAGTSTDGPNKALWGRGQRKGVDVSPQSCGYMENLGLSSLAPQIQK